MAKKRLFIGTFIDYTQIEYIYPEMQEDFNKALRKSKWVELENLHFTYKFLGEVEEERIPEIKEALKDELKEFNSMLVMGELKLLPNNKDPRVLYVPVYNAEEIVYDIYNSIENKMEKLGFPKEKRRFKPHITLVRIKEYSRGLIKSMMDKYSELDFGLQPEFKVDLIESELTPDGPIYKRV